MTTKPHATDLRVILNRLDLQIEEQSFLPGADAPGAVKLIGDYHNLAGWLERRVMPFLDELTDTEVQLHANEIEAIVAMHRKAVTR